ncbi:heavy metal translocating P-type ATPase [Fusibacter bizertensis]|uniref:Cd(2+)-exporting ATPase n=1 Tax=Fusibacter bizertensis TaxID=1488331 RepID=A0ABT6NC02_9FIRM|nr:heavy metal translocating P-type ATPase [Fusibacter bizertensis]MDH8677931.1 heavy metal translocating P-type ATPase [Fusibacter bizertensis]
MEKITLNLEGLGCANCAAKIESRAKNISGIDNVVLDFSRSKLTFENKDSNVDLTIDEIKNIVKSLEPDVVVSLRSEGKPEQKNITNAAMHSHQTMARGIGHNQKNLIRLIISLVLFTVGILGKNMPYVEFVALAMAYILSGHKVLYKSFRNILRGDIFDENFLMSIATFGAIAIGEYPEAVAVMIFYEIGEYFQDLAVNRSKHAISSLLDIRPDEASVLRGNFWMNVSPEEVQIDEIIMVKPGERVPLDGIIVEGGSNLDTSALTGESIPEYFALGDAVLSGSVVVNGIIKLKVTSVYAESTVARILALVENATSNKAPTENFITKFARYYTPIVVFFAIGLVVIPSFIFGFDTFDTWLYRGLIFLVISCPCALVVSVPLGFFSGIGNASKNGILIKGSNYLEALSHVDTIVFDKTGTLTEGAFEVYQTHLPDEQVDNNTLIKLATLAEYHSNHPVAKSIIQFSNHQVNLDDIIALEEVSGKGVIVKSKMGLIIAGNKSLMHDQSIIIPEILSPYTHIYIALDGKYIGAFDIRDKVKKDAHETIKRLKTLGYRVLMLTGDRKEAAHAVATSLDIDTVYSELLPEDKYEKVISLIHDGANVAFVGDGINDAPVLASANIGISMGAIGSDAAIEASDVVLMTDEPSKIPQAIQISKITKKIVTQNIVFALGTKLLIMALGTVGLSSMWMAIFADVGVTLIAVLNSTRVLRYKPKPL